MPTPQPEGANNELRVRNLNALFAWAAGAGDVGESAAESAAEGSGAGESVADRLPGREPMTKERAAFLQQALSSMTVDLAARLKAAVVEFNIPDAAEGAAEKKADALDEIIDLVEDLDFAKYFVGLGGLDLMLDALQSCHPAVQASAGDCLATASQNHPDVQEQLRVKGALPTLLALLAATDSPAVAVKSIRALSCIVSANAVASQAFLEAGGGGGVSAAISKHAGAPKILSKLAFLSAGLPEQCPAFAAEHGAGVIASLAVALVGTEDGTAWEQGLRAMLSLGSAHPAGHTQLRDPATKISALLAGRAAQLGAMTAEDREAHQDENEMLAALETLLGEEPCRNPPPVVVVSTATAAAAEPAPLMLPPPPAAGQGGSEPGSTGGAAATVRPAGAGLPAGAPVPGSKEDFQPTAEWQQVEEYHIIPAGLEIKFDLASGVNWARSPQP